MPLRGRRPSIRVEAPAEIRVGQPAELVVHLESPRDLVANAVHVDVECRVHDWHQWFSIPIDHLSSSDAELRLRRGESEVRLPLELPLGLAATTAATAGAGRDGGPPAVSYHAHVRVDLPWWPDAAASFDLTVLPAVNPAPRTAEPLPLAVSVDDGRLLLEGTLDANVLHLGARAHMRVAFARGGARGRVRAELRGTLAHLEPHWGPVPRIFAIHPFEIELAEVRPGRIVDLPIVIPRAALPSFQGRLDGLTWRLDVTARMGWEVGAASLPVTLVDLRTPIAHTERPGAPMPEIGDERLRAPWSEVATRHGLALEGERLLGVVQGTAVRVERAWERGQWRLTAELEYPSIELGLTVRAPALHELLRSRGRALGLDVPRWDQRHVVEADAPGQARPFVRALAEPLRRLEVAELDDTHARVRRDDPGERALALDDFVSDVLALAAALGDRRPAIPPPEGMEPALPAWQRLATRLEGRLSTATMRVAGRYGGLPAIVSTVWSADRLPRYTHVVLSAAAPLRVPDAGERDALLAQLSRGTLGATITAHELSVNLAAPLFDERDALERLARLAGLHELLRPSAGAYR